MIGAACRYFDIQQLFAVGIGFDIAGATLLARGLLASPHEIAIRSGTYMGYNASVSVGAARDRIDALVGLVALGVGFTLQAAGYLIELDRHVQTSPTGSKALVGVLAALAAIAVVAVTWLTVRGRLVKNVLIRVARYAYGAADPLELPHGGMLENFGLALDEPRRETEPAVAYLRRVYGISDAFYGDEQPYERASELPPPTASQARCRGFEPRRPLQEG
jgi:hypothetical protein